MDASVQRGCQRAWASPSTMPYSTEVCTGVSGGRLALYRVRDERVIAVIKVKRGGYTPKKLKYYLLLDLNE